MEKSTGKRPDELKELDFPYQLSQVWYSFLSLCSGRTHGMNGLNPLSFTEIKSWCDLTETKLTPLEIDIIKRLDSLYVKVANV